MSNNAQQTIETVDQFSKGKKGEWERWQAEMNAAKEATRKWHKQGQKTVNKYLADNKGDMRDNFQLNLFHSNITTVRAMMFGKLPEIAFSRKNMDFNDDPARVAGMIYQRMLNADIGTPNDLYSQALRQNLEDRLLPGLGVSRVRYEFEEEQVEVAPVFDQMTGQQLQAASTQTKITDERAPVDYVYWKDFAWSPARTWAEVRWVAFKTRMTRKQLEERFGDKIGKQIPLNAQEYTREQENYDPKENPGQDAMKRAEIWEIWNKEDKQLFWWCKDHPTILDKKDDPLGLTGFFPIPEPMTTNVTTTAYMPIPDYIMGQDLYEEIDILETRISKITEAVKVVGVYDAAEDGVKRMMTEGFENDLIPVDNWALFAEKGGLQGSIAWLPVLEVAQTLKYLIERRNDAKALLYEVTGISDIMRGAQASAGGAVSATERALEARFASVRIQALQDEFAKYATDLIRLRAEIVSKHFQPESIVKQSNIEYIPDKENIEPAVMLIKEDQRLIWRLEVKPESVAMVDYAQLKEERTSYMTALATFMQSSAPLAEMAPEAAPILMEMLKWGLGGFKGSNEIEGLLDQTIATMQQPKEEEAPEPPSPEQIKAELEQAKMQHEMQKVQSEQQFEREKWKYDQQMEQQQSQNRLQEIQAETEAKLAHEQAQAQLNVEEAERETVEVMRRETHKADETIRVNNAKPQPKAASPA